MDQDWGVKVRWDLKGSLVPLICGKWCLHLRMESLGPGPELVFHAPRKIPLNPCGRGIYHFEFRIRRGTIKDIHCSIPYKPVVTITYHTVCRKPRPIAGFVELPIMQFYDLGLGYVYSGNGKHLTEAEEESEYEVLEMLEPEKVDTFEPKAVEMFEIEDEGEEVNFEAAEDLEVESEKEFLG